MICDNCGHKLRQTGTKYPVRYYVCDNCKNRFSWKQRAANKHPVLTIKDYDNSVQKILDKVKVAYNKKYPDKDLETELMYMNLFFLLGTQKYKNKKDSVFIELENIIYKALDADEHYTVIIAALKASYSAKMVDSSKAQIEKKGAILGQRFKYDINRAMPPDIREKIQKQMDFANSIYALPSPALKSIQTQFDTANRLVKAIMGKSPKLPQKVKIGLALKKTIENKLDAREAEQKHGTS